MCHGHAMGAGMKFEKKPYDADTQNCDAGGDIHFAAAYEVFGFLHAFAFGSLFCAFLCKRAHR